MDFGRILSRAWEITWRWKPLWILGFLAARGQGSAPNVNSTFSTQDLQNGNLPNIDMGVLQGAILAFACLAILIGIALWVISIIARGGLIAGVTQVEDEGSTTFRRAWEVGAQRFWTLFGIGVLVALPIILVVIVMVIGTIALAGGAAALNSGGGDMAGPAAAGIFACLCPSICLLIVLGLVLGQIQIYAERAAILEGYGWIDAFKRGWQVLKENLGPTVILWLIFLVLGLVVAAIVFAITAPLFLALAALFGLSSQDGSAGWLLAPVCGFGLIATVLGAIIGAIITAFTSSSWTLAYRQLTGRGLPPATLTPVEPFPPTEPLPPTTTVTTTDDV